MNEQKTSIILLIYNSYRDPLFQNLLLEYIKTLSTKGNYSFELITFEQQIFALDRKQVEVEKKELLRWQIHWHPNQFHTGKFLLLKKAYDVFTTLYTVLKIKRKNASSYIFAFANVSAAISVVIAILCKFKLVIYSYEPHSEFMKDLGHWSSTSYKYKILAFLEKLAAKQASDIMTGTKHGVRLLESYHTSANLYRAPTAVNPDYFIFKPSAREEIRKELSISHETLYIYPGKFEGLYYGKELIQLFGALYSLDHNCYFLVATDLDHGIITDWFEEHQIPTSKYHLRNFIAKDEMSDYLSAADFGIVSIPPKPTQKYRSPTKVAEYLLCGLPYIVCEGISEDDDYALDNHVGAVLHSFSKESTISAYSQIQNLTKEEKSSLRKRCRSVALNYRSKTHIDLTLEKIFGN